MKKIINYIVYTMMFGIAIISSINDITHNDWSRIPTYLAIIPIVILIIGMKKILVKTKFKLNDSNELVLSIFIFLAYFLGSVLGFYNRIWWYDVFAHFISGFLTFYIAIYILKCNNKYHYKDRWFNLLFIFGIVFLVAGSWEIIEFIIDFIFNSDVQHSLDTGVHDTMEDIVVACFGAICCLPHYFKSIYKEKL